MSQDYSPANLELADDHNYSPHRFQNDITRIIVHVAGGSAQSAINTFRDPNRQASYHYIVDMDGTVYQMVRESDVAWHCGYWPWNQSSIGVSFAGSLSTNDDKTDAQYRAMSKLVAHLSNKYGVAVDRKHIKGHREVPGCSNPGGGGFSCHSEPGTDFPWRRFLRMVREAK